MVIFSKLAMATLTGSFGLKWFHAEISRLCLSVRGALAGERPCITDLKRNRLFTPVTVETRGYAFSPAESAFYETLGAFILDGRAYASILDG
jgi:hypothetical protein